MASSVTIPRGPRYNIVMPFLPSGACQKEGG